MNLLCDFGIILHLVSLTNIDEVIDFFSGNNFVEGSGRCDIDQLAPFFVALENTENLGQIVERSNYLRFFGLGEAEQKALVILLKVKNLKHSG